MYLKESMMPEMLQQLEIRVNGYKATKSTKLFTVEWNVEQENHVKNFISSN